MYIYPQFPHALSVGDRRKVRKVSLRAFLGKCHMKDRNACKRCYLMEKH